MGELDIDGFAEPVLEQIEHCLERSGKIRSHQTFKRHHQLGRLDLGHEAHHG